MDFTTAAALGLQFGMNPMLGASIPGLAMPAATSAAGGPTGSELMANVPLQGTVKNWMVEKGFGFVTPMSGGPDVFVHKNQLSDGEQLFQGASVTFECRFNPSRRKYEATSCRGASALGAAAPPAQQVAPPVPPPAGGYGKAPTASAAVGYSPYGALGAGGLGGLGGLTGAGVDPTLAAALMQLVAPQAGMTAGMTNPLAFGATAPAGMPAFDASALAAAAAVPAATTPALTNDAGAAALAAATQPAVAATAPAADGAAASSAAAVSQWAEAQDPTSGKTYYYHKTTRETRWEKPAE